MSLLLLSYKCGPLLLIVTLVSTSKHLSQIGTSRVQISIVSQRPFSPFLLPLYCYCSVGILASSMRRSYWHRQNHDSATPEFVPAHRKLTHCCHAKQLWNLNLEEHAQKHREPPFVIMRLLNTSDPFIWTTMEGMVFGPLGCLPWARDTNGISVYVAWCTTTALPTLRLPKDPRNAPWCGVAVPTFTVCYTKHCTKTSGKFNIVTHALAEIKSLKQIKVQNFENKDEQSWIWQTFADTYIYKYDYICRVRTCFDYIISTSSSSLSFSIPNSPRVLYPRNYSYPWPPHCSAMTAPGRWVHSNCEETIRKGWARVPFWAIYSEYSLRKETNTRNTPDTLKWDKHKCLRNADYRAVQSSTEQCPESSKATASTSCPEGLKLLRRGLAEFKASESVGIRRDLLLLYTFSGWNNWIQHNVNVQVNPNVHAGLCTAETSVQKQRTNH